MQLFQDLEPFSSVATKNLNITNNSKMKNVIFVLLTILLAFGCQKEPVDIITETPIINPPKTEISGSLFGKVTNESGDNLKDAIIQYNGKVILTDENGEFSIDDSTLFSDGTYIQVMKDGYFNGSRKIYATENQNYLHVQLIEKILLGTIIGSDGGIIEVEQAQIDLPAGTYMDINGLAYSGDINVFAKWLDPSKEETYLEMPGDLTGVDQNGELKALATFGMIAVELEDQNGQKVNLPENTKAMIQLPVPEELVSAAPETIPLWHFDDSYGTWVEEGQASLINNLYVGEVGHFSFWNCDIPVDLIEISGKVLINGNPSIGVKIKVFDQKTYYIVQSYTNNEGVFVSQVPQDGVFSITVYDACGTQLDVSNYGPYSVDSDIGTKHIEAKLGSFSLSGQIINCTATSLGRSFVVLDLGESTYAYTVDDEDSYRIELNDCTVSEASIYTVDIENKTRSKTHELSLFGHTLQNLESCNIIEEDSILTRSIPAILYDKMDWGFAFGLNYYLDSYSIVEFEENDGLTKYVYTINVIDWLSADKFVEGVFTFKEGEKEADYVINFSQGFAAEGTCDIIDDPIGRILTDTSTYITVTDVNIYPGDINEVYFAFRIN